MAVTRRPGLLLAATAAGVALATGAAALAVGIAVLTLWRVADRVYFGGS